MMSQTPRPMPNGASHGPRARTPQATMHQRQARGGHQALRRRKDIAALPREQRAERHGDEQRHDQRHEGEIEEGRADRDLVAGHRFQRERIERADEHGGAGR